MASTGTELVQQAINHELAESDEVVELAVRQYVSALDVRTGMPLRCSLHGS